MKLQLLIFVMLFWSQSQAYPNGAPLGSCDSMFPKHKHESQTTDCPFFLILQQSEISSNGSLNITLQGSFDKPFKGYLIMAFDLNNPEVSVGTFETDTHSHTISCHDRLKSAATHSSKSPKTAVHLTWFPPEDFQGDVAFMTTWVVSKRVFWLKQASSPVHIKLAKRSDDPAETPFIVVEDEVFIEELAVDLPDYFGLWTVFGLLFVGFSLALMAKIAVIRRSKKYDTLVTES